MGIEVELMPYRFEMMAKLIVIEVSLSAVIREHAEPAAETFIKFAREPIGVFTIHKRRAHLLKRQKLRRLFQRNRLAQNSLKFRFSAQQFRHHRAHNAALFGGGEPEYEVADFPIRELDLPVTTLAALEAAGYTSFLDIIDLERDDLLRIPGISAEDADDVLRLIESLTVEDAGEDTTPSDGGPSEEELAEAREFAADILGLPLPERARADSAPAPKADDAEDGRD